MNQPAPKKRGKLLGGSTALLVTLASVFAVQNEGMVLRSYADPVWGWDVPTACAGDTGSHIQKGQVFTIEQCLGMLNSRLLKKWEALAPYVTRDIYIHEAVALLSLEDNVGLQKVVGSTALAKHNRGEPWCDEFRRWTYVGPANCALPEHSKKCGGIVTRRERERAMCMGDIEGALGQ